MMRVLGNMLYHQRIFIVSDKIAPDRVQVRMHAWCVHEPGQQGSEDTVQFWPDRTMQRTVRTRAN